MNLYEIKRYGDNKMLKNGTYDLDEIDFKEIPRRNKIEQKSYYSESDFNDSNLIIEEETYEGNKITINELVKSEPKTIEEYVDIIKTRLHYKSVHYLSENYQNDLKNICIKEAKFKWKDLKRNIEDSTLMITEQIELRRRLFVNVISICEKLYNYYVKRADTLKSREVFSDSANFTRIKTLLACDLNKFLNIHSIKHHLAFDLKRQKMTDRSDSYLSSAKPKEVLNLKRITIKDLDGYKFIDIGPLIIEDFRLKYKKVTRRYKTIKENIRDLYDNMPVLETKNLLKLLHLPAPAKAKDSVEPIEYDDNMDDDRRMLESEPDDYFDFDKTDLLEDDETLLGRVANTKSPHRNPKILKQRKSKSMLNLNVYSLNEEINLNKADCIKDRFKTTDSINFKFNIQSSNDARRKRVDCLELYKDENEKSIAFKLKQDLEYLTLELKRKDMFNKELDDEPLLMNLTSKPDQKLRMKQTKAKIKAIDRRRREFLEEIKLPLVKKKSHPQSATVNVNFLKNFEFRLSDIRVSERILRFNITVKLFGPLYNDLDGEIESDMIQHLDRNLNIGSEVKEVYDELVRTVDDDYLRFDLDDYVQHAPNNLRYESCYSSNILKNFGRTKSINQNLAEIGKQKSPWCMENKDFREWNRTLLNSLFYKDDKLKSPLIEPAKEAKKTLAKRSKVKEPPQIFPQEIKPEKIELYRKSDPTTLTNKEFNHWYDWWKDNFTSEDYFKYLSTQKSDYVSLLFHLYDDKDTVSLEKSDAEIKLENDKKKAEAERNKIIDEMKRQKFSYEPGIWNPSSVFLGGLGNEPLPDENEDPLAKMRKNLELTRPKSKKFQFFKTDKEDSDEEEKAKMKMLKKLNEKKQESPQKRLERVWNLLKMSDSEKLDMAIKYCTLNYAGRLYEALADWESATDLIIEREKFIYDLENFERYASDPNRFFLKGYRGSSAARLEEALQREKLYNRIEQLQQQIEKQLVHIRKTYNDTLKYNGREYMEKMKWDRIEMLHWLTEERRIKYIKHEIRSKNLDINLLNEI